jgi:4'-phosphopantetheinyl transferase EntD
VIASGSPYAQLEATLAACCGAGVVVEVGAATVEAPLELLLAEERAAVARAVPSRQQEFAAGRVLARRALRRLRGVESPIPANPDRTPRWPAGVVGTLTHTRGLCVAAVALAGDVLALGLDAEEATPLEPELWPLVVRANERAWLRGDGLRAKHLFSAKESVYKAQHGLTGTLLDFTDVELDGLEAPGAFTARLLHPCRSASPALQGPLMGFALCAQEHLITGLVLRRGA